MHNRHSMQEVRVVSMWNLARLKQVMRESPWLLASIKPVLHTKQWQKLPLLAQRHRHQEVVTMNGKRVAYTTRVKLFLGLVSYGKHNGGPKVITPPIRGLGEYGSQLAAQIVLELILR